MQSIMQHEEYMDMNGDMRLIIELRGFYLIYKCIQIYPIV